MPAMTIGSKGVISIDYLQAQGCHQEETEILTISIFSPSSEFENGSFGFCMDIAVE